MLALGTYALAVVISSNHGGSGDPRNLLIFPLMFGLCAIVYGLIGYWNGERTRLRITKVRDLSAGPVVLDGVVEPAWTWLRTPFARRRCVFYDAVSIAGSGKGAHKLFGERNAVPFVLNDGTGRVLVLGRRARWDAAGDTIARLIDADDNEAVADGVVGGEGAVEAGDQGLAPPVLASSHDGAASREEIVEHGAETWVVLGERVTVRGVALSEAAAITERDACAGSPASLDLGAPFVIAPARFRGLHVLAGEPADVIRRARIHAYVGIGGAAVVAGSLLVLLVRA